MTNNNNHSAGSTFLKNNKTSNLLDNPDKLTQKKENEDKKIIKASFYE